MARGTARRILLGAFCAGALLIISASFLKNLRRRAPAPAPSDAGLAVDAAADAGSGSADAPPPPPPPSTTTLVLRITDAGRPVGARALLFAEGRPLRIGTLDLFGERQTTSACAIAPGVVGSWDGLILARGVGEIPIGSDTCAPSPAIPYGAYRVWVWRGVEHEIWEGTVDLREGRGRVELSVPLERAWTPYGTLAADLHVHSFGSNDSGLPNRQRVIAQAAAGIQVVALSDHNTNGDLDAEIAALGLEDVIASIASNELSSPYAHIGVYPVSVVPGAERGGSPSDAELIEARAADLIGVARRLGKDTIVQVNHPRLRWAAMFDITGWDGIAWPPPFEVTFDAIEVLSGYTAFNTEDDRRLDEGVRDLYTLVDHGRPVTPVGNSDTHDLNGILDGTARTYVFLERPATSPFDEPAFIAALRARRTVATSGPWLDVEVAAARGRPTVGPGQSLRARGSAWVDVTVEQARFVRVDRIKIATGGRAVRTIAVPRGVRRFRWQGAVPLAPGDTWIGVTADGDTPLPVELTGSLHQDAGRPGVTPLAIASPILVDADGDGRWRRAGADLALPAAPP